MSHHQAFQKQSYKARQLKEKNSKQGDMVSSYMGKQAV